MPLTGKQEISFSANLTLSTQGEKNHQWQPELSFSIQLSIAIITNYQSMCSTINRLLEWVLMLRTFKERQCRSNEGSFYISIHFCQIYVRHLMTLIPFIFQMSRSVVCIILASANAGYVFLIFTSAVVQHIHGISLFSWSDFSCKFMIGMLQFAWKKPFKVLWKKKE